MTKNLSQFAERMKKIREAINYSQREMSVLMGLTGNTQVSKFENGTSEPSIEILRKLTDKYDIDLHWLITGRLSPLFTGMVKELVRGTHQLAINICDGQKFLLETKIDLQDKIDRLQKDPTGNKAEIDRLSTLLNNCDEAYRRSIEVIADFEKKSDLNDLLNRCLSAFEEGLRPKNPK